MKKKHLKCVAGITCFILAGAWVFQIKSGTDPAAKPGMASGGNPAVGSRRDSRSRAGLKQKSTHFDNEPPSVTRALELPARDVDEKGLEASALGPVIPASTSHLSLTDDDILIRGGVLSSASKPSAVGDRGKGPRSIKSEDWKGAANLLVNALRSGDRFEVNRDQLMEFLRGKDLLGWPESYRNWIGDELMTALRQDMPETAFADLKTIAVDSNAPAAMRDYSVQHISHLMTSGVIGKDGADYIWQTLEKNDPQTLSTALISLHRLSEQVPDLVSAKDVQAAAERLKESQDERTRITAGSILKK